MLKTIMSATLITVSIAAASSASAQTAASGFEKKNYNYSEWTKGRFSEAVTVTGPGKMIFTLLTITQLAWPGMIVEIDVTAIVPLK
jgi:hypothetical protein